MSQKKFNRLGRTELKVSPLVYGTLPLGPLQADLSPGQGGELIRFAIDTGVNILDTAELYGTYRHIREGLNGCTKDIYVASKTHAATAEGARKHVENALVQMDLQQLDIVHIHAARLKNPLVDRAAVLDELLKMKQEGLVRFIGLSTHYICAVLMAADHSEIDVIHPLINKHGMGILDGDATQMAEAIAYAAMKDKGIYGMKALAGGNFISEARKCFEFVLSLKGMQALAVGMLSREEIAGNFAFMNTGAADPQLWNELEKRKREIKIMEQFCKGCGECVVACTNHGIYLEDGKAKIKREECILCGYCAAACPEFMIRVL